MPRSSLTFTSEEVQRAAQDSQRYWSLSPEERDAVAEEWSDVVYFCPECDEACRMDFTHCPRYPAEHHESGFMGTGESYPSAVQDLARQIESD